MGKRPKLENLDYLFRTQDEFSLTDSQYEAKTGTRLPKNLNYLLKNSALAKRCNNLGFSIGVQEKIVYFKKKREEKI